MNTPCQRPPQTRETTAKIELHVHIEGTVQPSRLLAIARRNKIELPYATVADAEAALQCADFANFFSVYGNLICGLRTERDFREILVSYAAKAKAQGAIYLEVIFSAPNSVRAGASYDEVFNGYCDGVVQAREEHGLEVRLTPDLNRRASLEEAETVAEYAMRYRSRGVVGVGLGGFEPGNSATRFSKIFARCRDAGLASLPHAGEASGPESIRSTIEALKPRRLRHGFRASEDPALMVELAEAGIVLDIAPTANVRTGLVPRLEQHPLPTLIEAGVLCSLSTDNPAFFGTDLEREYEAVESLWGIGAEAFLATARLGACDLPD